MRQDEEGKREEAGSSRRQEGRRKVRKPDEEEAKLTELRWGHFGAGLGVTLGSFWGSLGLSGGLWGSAALRLRRCHKTVQILILAGVLPLLVGFLP